MRLSQDDQVVGTFPPDRIGHPHALAVQNVNLPQLRNNLFWLVALPRHLGPPGYS
jgi:hypothetical protein